MIKPAEVLNDYFDLRLTERGHKIINRATAITAGAAVVAGTGLFIEAAENGNAATNRPTAAEIAQNQDLLIHWTTLTPALTLKHGVKVRLSKEIDDGNGASHEFDNIVDDLIPKGKELHVNKAIDAGNGWVAFLRPGLTVGSVTSTELLQDMVYVDAEGISGDPKTANLISGYNYNPMTGPIIPTNDNSSGGFGPNQLPTDALQSTLE